MGEATDTRWKQRFQNLDKAFAKLDKAVAVVGRNRGDELLEAGLIQTYEFTFELAWKTLKDLLTEDGFDVNSPKATLRTAFANGYISNGELWLKALEDRNLTTHTYDEGIAQSVVNDILCLYHPMIAVCMTALRERL